MTSSRGGARTAVLIALAGTALAVVAAVMWLTPRKAPVAPVKPAPQRAAAPEARPAPIAPPEPAPPSAAPRRRVPRAAPPPSPAPAPAPAVADCGVLHIDSDVPGASVFIDRVYIGTTPATARDLVPGKHQLNASAQGYDGISHPIEVEAGEKSLTVRFKEVRLDAAIDVVHKHGIGSCRGRLVATPDGIRYETTNKGDAFSAPLTALDEFTVDYLKKTLHLKVKGRTYNFTDPDGNADRLFVFHRDVEKARQQLAAR